MKLDLFLTQLFNKAKIDLKKPEIVTALAAAKDIDLDDATANLIDTALMAEDAAVNNAKIRGTIKAQILNGVDADLETELSDAGLDETEMAALKGQKDTIVKTRETIRTLKQKIKNASKSTDPTTHKALNDQVAALNLKLKEQSEKFAEDIKTLNEKNDGEFVNYQLLTELGSKSYSLPDQMSAEMKRKTAAMHVRDELAAKGLKLIKSDTGVKLVKNDGTEPYDDKHTLLQLPSFIDGVLAKNGLLKTSGGPNPQTLQNLSTDQSLTTPKPTQSQAEYANSMQAELAAVLGTT